MDKFIEFNGGVFNTRYIMELTKGYRGFQYCISLYTTNEIEHMWFNNKDERDTIFNQLSRELLNE